MAINPDFNRHDLIGKKESEAIKICERNGYTTRIVERDGKALGTTDDVKTDRMNLYIAEDGQVYNAQIG